MDPALQSALVEAVQSVATPTWADIATALIAFLALIGTIVMAFLQKRIAKQQTIIAAKQADIADQQNKIALFEKRYTLYDQVGRCTTFAFLLEEFGTLENFLWLDKAAFADTGRTDHNVSLDDVMELNRKTLAVTKQADYLFGKELSEKIAGLCARLVLLVSLMEFPQADQTVYADRKESFCTYAREFEEQHMPLLEARLNIR